MKNILFLFLSAFAFLSCKSFNPLIVNTDKGAIEGYQENGILIFKGVPFAAPPIDDLRWKAPKEHEEWEGVLAAKKFSASPMQRTPQPFMMWTEEFIAPPEPLNEDCLYLNVWTKNSKKKKPVFVWIYGGGFNSGSSACVIYDGEEYAREDVVFVSINYRVNIFGYFAHPALSAENDLGISGNYGLLDQIEALKWVQRNIEKLGGDPDNVTIAGQSAGSMSIHSLVASPLAKGLFHKAIGQSGGLLAGNRAIGLKESEGKGLAFTEKLDKGNISDLRKIPGAELYDMVQNAGGFGYAPILDGIVLPTDLKEHFSTGNHNDVPFISGWVTGDGRLYSRPKMSVDSYKENVSKQMGDKTDAFLELFPGDTEEDIQASISKKNLLDFGVRNVHLLSGYQKSDTYVYEISHVPVDKPNFPNYGAFHTSDVPLALRTLHTWERPWREIDLKMEKLVSTYWLNFIKTGNPNGQGLPEWNIYKNGGIQIINRDTHFSKNLYHKELEVLD
ncbi:MAG: para-nitrobenzyl esterase [Arcticibacterium sp.]|jgi:para-nitrobenzyl esterase